MIYEHQAECPYCGQQIIVTSTKPVLEKEELFEEAIENCTCEEARLDRDMRATEASIQGTIGEGCMDRGMPYVASEQTQASIRKICEMILLDEIGGDVKLVIPGGDSLRMKKNGNAVKIKRSTSRQLEI